MKMFQQNKNVIFFFFEIKGQEGRIGTVWQVPVGGEDVEKGCSRVDMVQILCTHICKWKNDTF
jgi:hypothetical protein